MDKRKIKYWKILTSYMSYRHAVLRWIDIHFLMNQGMDFEQACNELINTTPGHKFNLQEIYG